MNTSTHPVDPLLPRISIVTPSFNQGTYIQSTLRSVLDQGYPNLEYIVIDGGSSDGSVDIIRKHENKLAYWVSEKDAGQYDAINKGFARSTGEIMAWINSDDLYTPWAFRVVAEIFSTFPQIEWISSCFPLFWNKAGVCMGAVSRGGFSRHLFLRGGYLPGSGWYSESSIQQESTFWRRSLWERTGGRVDASMKLAGDFDLWLRFAKEADLYGVQSPLGGGRFHSGQKTASFMTEYIGEAKESLRRNGCRPFGRLETSLRQFCLNTFSVKFLRKRGFFYGTKICRPNKYTDGFALVDSIAHSAGFRFHN